MMELYFEYLEFRTAGCTLMTIFVSLLHFFLSGECYVLQFTPEAHPGGWGGSHPSLVGHAMVVQVTNIGYDVSGDHSFDLQIPAAGQGAFTNGCDAMFPGFRSGDFDCDNSFGGW